MEYVLGDLLVNGTTDRRREDDAGMICIGGDMVDVRASAAYGQSGGTVRLVNVVVVTGDNFKSVALSELRDELVNAVVATVAECYASIGSDTFLRSKQHA